MPIVLFFIAFSLTVVFYSIERAQFLFWNWDFYRLQSLGDLLQAFFHGLRFDLSAIAFLSAVPFLVFWICQLAVGRHLTVKSQRWLLAFFALFQIPLMIINLGDAEFINFLGRRYTFDALFFFREIPGKFWSLLTTYWHLNLLNFAILASFAILCVAFVPRKNPPAKKWSRKKSFVIGLGVLVALVGAARGGWQRKPLNFAHAQIFLNPMMNNLALNSAFTFLQTVKRKSLVRQQWFDSDEMLRWLRWGQSQESLLDSARNWEKPNIVLIILESFALEYMGRPHQGDGYTPFLDELSRKSLFFPNTFANARRSIEGIGAILGGIPALMNEPFISSQYLTNYFLGAGTWLQKEGYHTSFFHGAQNGSMYFDQFMGSAGVKHYYGLSEYPNSNDSDGTWGIWDEPFLLWMTENLSAFPEPFFSTVFTLTSHHPFAIPPEYQGRFPKGTADIHESIGYADFALRKFFEAAQAKPWYKNTIFILTADHTYRPHRSGYDNEVGFYRIPLLIFSPGLSLPRPDESQIVQQIDILPSILDLVGIEEKEKNYLGSSVFKPGDRFAITFSDGRYLFLTQSHYLTLSADGQFRFFSMKDPGQKFPLEEPLDKKKEMENRLKAAIQYFSQGMWDNKLYYPSGR